MIYHLLILTKSGITIFYKAYSLKSIIQNEVMVAAFFSAMFSFSNNLTGRALDLLCVGDKQFIIKESPDLLLIVLIDTDDSISEVAAILDELEDFLYKNYKKFIAKKTFNGNLKRFEGIEPKIDDIVLKKPIPKKTGDLLETLEEIKKLINTRKKGTKLKLDKLLDEKIKEAKGI
ncbi:MAG: hypothetical protein ACFFDN_43660 [Candidatus Hodarchaeota archaeon]